MIRYFVATVLFIIAGITSLTAQSVVRVVDSLYVRTTDARDNGVPNLRFGFGSDYTDGPDTADGKGEFPFPFIGGPTGFAMALYVKDFLGDPGFDYRDIRGLPDSVTSSALTHFKLTYTIRIQAGIGLPIIRTSDSLSRGIDSIVLSSTQPGANYRHVFHPEGGIDTVSRREISELLMEVYFDYQRAASIPSHDNVSSLTLTPNPAAPGDRVLLGTPGNAVPGSVVLSDIMGRPLIDEASGVDPVLLLPRDVPPGCYYVSTISRGRVQSVSRLIIVH